MFHDKYQSHKYERNTAGKSANPHPKTSSLHCLSLKYFFQFFFYLFVFLHLSKGECISVFGSGKLKIWQISVNLSFSFLWKFFSITTFPLFLENYFLISVYCRVEFRRTLLREGCQKIVRNVGFYPNTPRTTPQT